MNIINIDNIDNIIGTTVGNMYEVTASAFTVYLKNGSSWTEIFIDIPCNYDERLTTGYYWSLGVDEDNNVFIEDLGMYPEEAYSRDEIDHIYQFKEATVAELYLHKTMWEAIMEKGDS